MAAEAGRRVGRETAAAKCLVVDWWPGVDLLCAGSFTSLRLAASGRKRVFLSETSETKEEAEVSNVVGVLPCQRKCQVQGQWCRAHHGDRDP